MVTRLLVVDDEDDLCALLQESLQREGYEVDVCFNVKQAKIKLERFTYDLVLTDLNMGAQYGLELVTHICKNIPQVPVIVMSAYGSEDVSLMALKAGAFDFITKPINNHDLLNMIERALSDKQPESSVSDKVLDVLVGNSEPIQALKSRLIRIARGQAPVFIQGESGSGKEVVSNIIHNLSSRSNGPYVAINCGAIPAELIESELFGHKKGSFTGATQDKIGLIQSAQGGTLFLDEVAELPLSMQVKLLRAVQERKIRPIGSDSEISVDFRLISATHRNIEQMVSKNQFRQDLYFRLHVMDVNVPPLRDRGQDIVLIAEFFIKKICGEWGLDSKKISPDVKKWLVGLPYHGNVRELHNMMQRAITLSEGEYVTLSDFEVGNQPTFEFQINFSSDQKQVNLGDTNVQTLDLHSLIANGLNSGLLGQISGQQTIQDKSAASEVYIPVNEGLEAYLHNVEKAILEQVLESVHQNSVVAAKILKIDGRAMRYKIKKFDIKSD